MKRPPTFRFFLLLLTLAGLLLGSGCAVNEQRAALVPGASFGKQEKYFVAKLPADERGIDRMIAENLQLRGVTVAYGSEATLPADYEILVSYQDKWMWDMTMYMLQLNIQIKDARTGSLLASGESKRTSLVRKSPEFMVDEVLDEIFAKLDPSLVTPNEE